MDDRVFILNGSQPLDVDADLPRDRDGAKREALGARQVEGQACAGHIGLAGFGRVEPHGLGRDTQIPRQDRPQRAVCHHEAHAQLRRPEARGTDTLVAAQHVGERPDHRRFLVEGNRPDMNRGAHQRIADQRASALTITES